MKLRFTCKRRSKSQYQKASQTQNHRPSARKNHKPRITELVLERMTNLALERITNPESQTYSRWTNYSNPAPMSCRLPLVPPNFNFVSLFLILGFYFFRPFEGANQTKKNNIVIGGAGGLLDYKGLNNSSIYGSTRKKHNLVLERITNPESQTKHQKESQTQNHRPRKNHKPCKERCSGTCLQYNK